MTVEVPEFFWVFCPGAFVVSLVASLFFTRWIVSRLERAGMTGVDVNKRNKPRVAEPGGPAVFMAFFLGVSLVMFLVAWRLRGGVPSSLAITLAVSGAAVLVGLFDDLNLAGSRFFKVLAIAIFSLPLVAYRWHDPLLWLPFFGEVNLGFVYLLVLVPLGVTGAANAINMTAGYNGVEAGIGLVVSFFLVIVAFLDKAWTGLAIFSALAGACLGFLYYNRYPSRVFPGDSGTLFIGTAIACGVIANRLELAGVIAILPAFYELATTMYWLVPGRMDEGRRLARSPRIDRNGRIRPPRHPRAWTVSSFYTLLALRPMREPTLVLAYLSLYVVSGVLAVLLWAWHLGML